MGNAIWANWVDTYTGITNSTGTVTVTATANGTLASACLPTTSVIMPTAEEMAALDRARREQNAAVERSRREHEVKRRTEEELIKQATEKARVLLIDHLDPNQKAQFLKTGTFDLRTDKHLYRIRPGGLVERINEQGVSLSRFCIHADASYRLPRFDQALIHKLFLESNEAGFLATANETRIVFQAAA
jgi:hypothetical protein